MDLGDDITSPDLKRQRLSLAEESLNAVRFIGDTAVAAFFSADKDKAREEKRVELADRLRDYLAQGDVSKRPTEEVQALQSGKFGVTPFHWEIEFPEVFSRENPGFDAIVGNPPFAGGRRIRASDGEPYLHWILVLHESSVGNADLVAHFFRRGFALLREAGTLGLIATNTIAQGDTRQSSLAWIRTRGNGVIYSASRRTRWPGEAAVVVSVVWISKGIQHQGCDLDGKPVTTITAFLFHTGPDANPAVLTANSNRSFQGSILLGQGFVFDDKDSSGKANSLMRRDELLAINSKNGERIMPLLGGEEVNSSPSQIHYRYAIDFADWPLKRSSGLGVWNDAEEREKQKWLRQGIVPEDYPNPVAADWPDLLKVIENSVKPERETKSKEVREYPWWRG